MSGDDTISVEELAAMHGVNIESLRRVLRQDEGKPENERVLPGAYHTNPANRSRGDWRIPRATAEAFQPRPRGRPKNS